MIAPLTIAEAEARGVEIRNHPYREGACVRVNAGSRFGALHRVLHVDGDILTVRCLTVPAPDITVHYVDCEAR